jgi:hypothetical protein
MTMTNEVIQSPLTRSMKVCERIYNGVIRHWKRTDRLDRTTKADVERSRYAGHLPPLDYIPHNTTIYVATDSGAYWRWADDPEELLRSVTSRNQHTTVLFCSCACS